MNNPMNSTLSTGLPQGAQNGTPTPDKGKDGYRPEAVSSATGAAAPRLSRKRLLALETELSDLDWQILGTIGQCRAILGKQIRRFYFTDRASKNANTTAANRRLKALSDSGLIAAINRKVDCRSRGYVAYIYYLTEAGEHILQIHRHEPEVRKRNIEPSTATLAHTVSVAECYVLTVETCRKEDMRLTELQMEPECWRPYQVSYKNRVLKPDLAIVTEKQDWMSHDESWYELRWFIEIDLNTEDIQTIIGKCRRYYEYYKSDTEQRLHGDVFPLVAWIVKTEARKRSLIRHIRETFPQYPRIFAVILPDEFTGMLRDELEMEECICPL